MKNVLYFQNSFNRPNLIFEVRHKEKDCIADIAKFIKEHYPKKSGIIYTTTTKESEKVAKELKSKYKMKCEPYHASLSDKKRHKIHSDWLNDEINIVVATIAFGMGINKLDVRFVIHHSLSKSIAHYY
jgi:bloom syndrome protein